MSLQYAIQLRGSVHDEAVIQVNITSPNRLAAWEY
jgi:hypothetical protein